MRTAPFVHALIPAALCLLALGACDDKPADAAPSKSADASAAANKADANKADANKAADAKAAEAPVVQAGQGPVIDHTVKLLDGSEKKLSDYRGKAVLVVNTASECGFTPQYAGLQELYGKYKEQGLEVLAFPSNDFGAQEPGDATQIREFVDSKYSVDFAMFDKVHATGPDKSPLYKTLTEETAEGIAGDVKWNFTKFLVDPQGHVVARFESPVDPMDAKVTAAVEQVLPKG